MTHLPRPIFRSYNRIGRHWIKRPRPQHIERNKDHNFEFTVASYNVLADQLLHEHPALYTHYSHEPWVYDWNYRKHNLLDDTQMLIFYVYKKSKRNITMIGSIQG